MTDTSRTAPDRDVLDDAAEVFQLLSAPGRLHLLWVLSNEEVDVTTLVAAVGGTKAGISQHLSKLRLAGWVNRRRDGRRILYRVVDSHIVTLVHQGVEHILHERAGRAPVLGGSASAAGPTRTASSPIDEQDA
jgi:DNA-binding transcriptional ArsR family regulator